MPESDVGEGVGTDVGEDTVLAVVDDIDAAESHEDGGAKTSMPSP